jgi:hypothetical protein
MATRSAPPCEHELRPGTAVCLRCQHAERAAKRAKQRQMFARGAAATLVLGVIAAIGIVGATALRSRAKSKPTPAPGDVPTPSTNDSTSTAAEPPRSPDSATVAVTGKPPAGTVLSAALAKPAVIPSTVSRPGIAITPVVPIGRTALRDTMTADRDGDTVRVNFDLMLTRTRRPDKFEAIVRSTLPQVFGAAADSALQALPVGALAQAGDLTTTLRDQGYRIPLPGGRTIAVWPETRAGRDGPLVVAYRAVASR